MGSTLDRVLARVVGRMTKDVQERRNVFWQTITSLFYGAAGALFGGEIWAGYLSRTGFTNTQIGILASVGTFTTAFGLLAFMGVPDRIHRRIRTYVTFVMITAIAPMAVVIIALMRPALPLHSMLALLIGVTLFQTLVSSINVTLDYPILVRVVSTAIRGRVFAILAMSYSILAIVLGLVSARVLKDLPYPTGYACCFAAGAGFFLLRALSFSRQKELPQLAVPGASRSALPFAAILDVLRMKEFQWLAPPHVLRGLSSAMIGFAIPVGMKHLSLPPETPGYATASNQAAGVLSGVALAVIADRWGPGRSTLLGDTLLAAGMGTLVLFHSPWAFLGLYFVLQFGRTIEDNAVPFGTTIIVPAELMGAFSSARLMVLQGSSAIGMLAFGYLFDHYNPVLLFGAGALLKLVNGVWFWYVFRLKPPARKPPAEEVPALA